MGDVSDAIQMKLRKAVDTISSVAGLFNASNEVSRQEFGKYYDTLNHEESGLEGIQGIGFHRLCTGQRAPGPH
jgi:CHASE1-domain containing sensor protein